MQLRQDITIIYLIFIYSKNFPLKNYKKDAASNSFYSKKKYDQICSRKKIKTPFSLFKFFVIQLVHNTTRKKF